MIVRNFTAARCLEFGSWSITLFRSSRLKSTDIYVANKCRLLPHSHQVVLLQTALLLCSRETGATIHRGCVMTIFQVVEDLQLSEEDGSYVRGILATLPKSFANCGPAAWSESLGLSYERSNRISSKALQVMVVGEITFAPDEWLSSSQRQILMDHLSATTPFDYDASRRTICAIETLSSRSTPSSRLVRHIRALLPILTFVGFEPRAPD